MDWMKLNKLKCHIGKTGVFWVIRKADQELESSLVLDGFILPLKKVFSLGLLLDTAVTLENCGESELHFIHRPKSYLDLYTVLPD